MKKTIVTIMTTMAIVACGSSSGTATLKDLTNEIKVLKDAPPYNVYEDEHWGPIANQVNSEINRLDIEMEGYSITTESETDGIEVVWPCEVIDVSFDYPLSVVNMLCKIRLTRDIHEDEISHKRPNDFYSGLLKVIGMDGSEPCAYIMSYAPRADYRDAEKGQFRWEGSKRVFQKGAEITLNVRMGIKPSEADDYARISKIVIVSAKDNRADGLRNTRRI